jgi:hypothetical protein
MAIVVSSVLISMDKRTRYQKFLDGSTPQDRGLQLDVVFHMRSVGATQCSPR